MVCPLLLTLLIDALVDVKISVQDIGDASVLEGSSWECVQDGIGCSHVQYDASGLSLRKAQAILQLSGLVQFEMDLTTSMKLS